MFKKQKQDNDNIESLSDVFSYAGFEDAKINIIKGKKQYRQGGQIYDVAKINVQSGPLSVEIDFGIISEYKYLYLLNIKKAIQNNTIINIRMCETSPNLGISEENDKCVYYISDGISIKIFISKNLFTKLINQLITIKIETSKSNMVEFLKSSVKDFYQSCSNGNEMLKDSVCVKEIETILNVLYEKYKIKYDPVRHNILTLNKRDQQLIISAFSLIEQNLLSNLEIPCANSKSVVKRKEEY